jgi:DNA-binding IclR family transcriptional regulator
MKSLGTALRLFGEFSQVADEVTVTELASRLNLPKSQVSRMLATFRETGWVSQNPRTRAFSVGLKAYAIGARFVNANRLTREALPMLRSVVDRCGHTATLSVLDGHRPLYLLGIEAPVFVEFGSLAGSYFPFHATAPGKMLAAYAGERKLARMISEFGLPRLTQHTITDSQVLRDHLARVRAQGFSASLGERTPGIGGLQVPVFGAESTFLAALGIAYPLKLVNVPEFPYYVGILHAAAQVLSLRLGADSYPFQRAASIPAPTEAEKGKA